VTGPVVTVVGTDATMVYDAVHNAVVDALGDLDPSVALQDFTVRDVTGGGESVVVTNPGTSLAYVRFGGDLSVTASSADMPVLPTSRVVLSVNSLITYAAAMLAGGSGSVLFTRGDGSVL